MMDGCTRTGRLLTKPEQGATLSKATIYAMTFATRLRLAYVWPRIVAFLTYLHPDVQPSDHTPVEPEPASFRCRT